MDTTELGVYVLGATALVLLASAGIAYDQPIVTVAAALAAGLSYLSQVLAATAVLYRNAGHDAPPVTDLAAGVAALAVLTWAAGLFTFAWRVI